MPKSVWLARGGLHNAAKRRMTAVRVLAGMPRFRDDQVGPAAGVGKTDEEV